MSDYMTRNAAALRSYDAMLARGDDPDIPLYTAPVQIEGLSHPEHLTADQVRANLKDLMDSIDALTVEQDDEDGLTWVEAEGTIVEVEAGREDEERERLGKALEEMGYMIDGVTVQSYEDVMDE